MDTQEYVRRAQEAEADAKRAWENGERATWLLWNRAESWWGSALGAGKIALEGKARCMRGAYNALSAYGESQFVLNNLLNKVVKAENVAEKWVD
jgi:hypothetical protein